MSTDLRWMDGADTAELIRDGGASAVEVVAAAIERCEKLNPRLNAIVATRFEKALDEARFVDAQPREQRGALAGIPYFVKDNNVYVEGMPTMFGSAALSCNHESRESDIVKMWRDAGLIILGKTNTPEFAFSFTTEPMLFGPTSNPWDRSRSPGGSSGGAAAVVASGMVPIAHGNDAGGSIRVPSSACGLFGLKPTRGRVSLAPYDTNGWFGLNQEHVLTRSVRDSRAMLAIHADGPAASSNIASARPNLSKLRVTIGRNSIAGVEANAEMHAAVDSVASILEASGATLIEKELPSELEQALRGFVLAVCCAIDITLSDRASGEAAIEPITRASLTASRAASANDLARAIQGFNRAAQIVREFFANTDLYLTPVLPSIAWPLGELASPEDPSKAPDVLSKIAKFGAFTNVFNASGNPAMSIPAGLSKGGLPIGVQCVASHWQEELLFEVAHFLEAELQWQDALRKHLHHI